MKSFLFEVVVFPDNTINEVADLTAENARFHKVFYHGIAAKDYFMPRYQKMVRDGCKIIKSKALMTIDFTVDDQDQIILIKLTRDQDNLIHVQFFQQLVNPLSGKPVWEIENTLLTQNSQTNDWSWINFQFILNNAIEAIVVHDESGNILFTNNAFNEFFDYQADKNQLSDYFTFKAHDYQTLRSLLTEKVTIPVSLLKDESGQLIEYALQSSELYFNGQKVYGSVVIEVPDIRSRFRNLQETEQRYRSIVTNMCTIAYAYRYDPRKDAFHMEWIDGHIEILPFDDVNDMFDLEKFYAVVDPRDLHIAVHKEEMLRKGKSTFSTFRAYGRHGKLRWIVDHNWYVGKSDDGSYRFYGILTDLTNEKKAGNQLNQLWVAINNSPNTVILIDGQGEIEFVNPAVKKDLGYDPDYFMGQSYKKLLSFVKEKNIGDTLKKTLRENKVWTTKLHCRNAIDEEMVFMITISPVLNADDGHLEKVVVVSQNITQMMELEKQLFHKDKLSTIGLFASGIAHDFNNILQIISTYNELISMHSENDLKTQTYVEQINNAKLRGIRLIDHLLTFGKPGIVQKQELDINALIFSNIGFLNELIPKRISFKSEVTHHCRIYGDETSIQQLLINLIRNAVQAIPETGMISLRSDLVKAGLQNNLTEMDMISIEVEDNGVGIPAQHLSRVMEPYYSTKKSGDGTGLGLAIVNSIVNDHDGIVKVISEESKGTKFTVLIPAISKNQPQQH